MRMWRSIAALFTVAVIAGCEPGTSPGMWTFEEADHLRVVSDEGVLFLTQSATDGSAMDALFSGLITVDDTGCLRLESEADYRVTVVWPAGYSLDRGADALRVADADGGIVGEIGGTFTLGGGEVPELTDALGFTANDRDLAHRRCPGRYWIVNAG